MRVQFIQRDNGPERLVAEAEIVFDEDGPLRHTKLVGFCLWRGPDGQLYVTLPARPFGSATDRKYFDYLRSTDGDLASVKNVKVWILAEYERQSAG